MFSKKLLVFKDYYSIWLVGISPNKITMFLITSCHFLKPAEYHVVNMTKC